MRLKSVIGVGVLFAFAASMWAADDPRLGTWKINLEKSKLRNRDRSKGTTMTIEASPEGKSTNRITFNQTRRDGTVQTFEDLRTYDGKERPSTMSQGQTEISEIIDARTRQTTFKKDGKQTYCATSTVSRDGKTMTNRVEGIDDKGKAFEEIQVFNRQ